MAKGDVLPPEGQTTTDPETGAEMRQLTAHRGNSYHLYFTNPGWYDGGRRLLFGSDRDNRTNLYGLSLETGAITQLTDLATPPRPGGHSLQGCHLNPVRDEVYLWSERRLLALDLSDLAERVLADVPDGMAAGNYSVSADGRFVYAQLHEDLSARMRLDLGHGYVGFQEFWEARPLCRLVRIDTRQGGIEVMFEDRCWLGHVNASPARPELLTFCHEGPWHLVDQRIWGFDTERREAWPIRRQRPGERMGHEYWFQDGVHIGYQGWDTVGRHVFGSARYDDSERVEMPSPRRSMHVHSNELGLIVGDGSATHPELLLWRVRDGVMEGPRKVLRHRCSFHSQDVHVHPRFSPDGAQILFTSDAGGYGDLYLTPTPDFDRLGEADIDAVS